MSFYHILVEGLPLSVVFGSVNVLGYQKNILENKDLR